MVEMALCVPLHLSATLFDSLFEDSKEVPHHLLLDIGDSHHSELFDQESSGCTIEQQSEESYS